MADGYDGSIVINTKMDLKGITTGTNKASAQISKLTKDFDKQVASINKNEKAIDDMNAKLKTISEIETKTKITEGLQRDLENATNEADKFRRIAETLEMGKAPEEAEKFYNKMEISTTKADELKNQLSQIVIPEAPKETAEQLSSSIAQLTPELEQSKEKASGLASEIAKISKVEGIQNIANGLKTMAKNAVNAIGKVANLTKNVLGLGKSSSNASNGFEKLGSKIKTLVGTAFVFSVLRKGLNALRNTLGNVLLSNTQFANSLNSIKVNLWTAFASIYNAVLPAINTLMSALSKVTSAIAQFVATLFGTTISSAKASAKLLYDQAQAIKNTGKSAKKAKKELDNFTTKIDELNVASQETADTDTGAGISGLDLGTVGVDDTSWLLKDAYQLGLDIGTKIVEGLQAIPWGKIQAWAVKFATAIADFLNGIVDSKLIQQMGTTLAEGINTAILFAYTFVTTFKWGNFGKAIGEGINNFFATIKWAELGQTFSNYILGVFDMINTAITEVNWTQVGEDIKTFLKNIDWEEIYNAVKDFVKNVFTGFFDFLGGLGGPGLEILVSILLGIAVAIKAISVAMGIYNAVMPIATIITTAFGVSTMVAFGIIALIIVAIVALVAGIILLIKNWDTVKEVAENVWNKIKEIWGIVANWFKDTIVTPITNSFSNMWSGLTNGAKNAWQGVKNAFSGVANWFKDIFSTAWNNVKNIFSTGGKIFSGIVERNY